MFDGWLAGLGRRALRPLSHARCLPPTDKYCSFGGGGLQSRVHGINQDCSCEISDMVGDDVIFLWGFTLG